MAWDNYIKRFFLLLFWMFVVSSIVSFLISMVVMDSSPSDGWPLRYQYSPGSFGGPTLRSDTLFIIDVLLWLLMAGIIAYMTTAKKKTADLTQYPSKNKFPLFFVYLAIYLMVALPDLWKVILQYTTPYPDLKMVVESILGPIIITIFLIIIPHQVYRLVRKTQKIPVK